MAGISRRPRSRRCERSALIYQHSDDERQREVAAGLDDLVQRGAGDPRTMRERLGCAPATGT